MRVLRAAESRTITPQVGNEPLKLLEGARLDALMQEISPQGFLITSVAPGSAAAALGLKPNEILRSLDNNRLAPPGVTVENYLRGLKVGGKTNLEVVKTTVLNVTVRLGSRPPEFISDPKDRAEAQGRFLQWWQDQGGDLSLIRPPDRIVYNPNPLSGRIAPETSVIP